ncbi:MAG: hypothetical protein DRH24_17395, partial [Deltaproteobacteria bacterium]
VFGTDLNSGEHLVATTASGGKGVFVVQTPADLRIDGILTSVDRATVQQDRDWYIDVVIENAGESDLQIKFDSLSTDLNFSTSNDFSLTRPTELAGGGNILSGGAIDTLHYVVAKTGSVSGNCVVTAVVSAEELNSTRLLATDSSMNGVEANVVIEEAALLEILALTPMQNPVTINQARSWVIEMRVRNSGGSDVTLKPDSVGGSSVNIPAGSGFVIENPSELKTGGNRLAGGEVGLLDFVVSTTGSVTPGKHVITGSIAGEEDNSGRLLNAVKDVSTSTDSVIFQAKPVPSYVQGSIEPVVLSSGAGFSFECSVASTGSYYSTLHLDRSSTSIKFGDADGDTFTAYTSPLSDTLLEASSQATLRFEPTIVDTSIATGTYYPLLYLHGIENGNPFYSVVPVFPDSVVIEEAPQLSINEIMIPQSVTESQERDWKIKVVLQNNGEASVKLDLDPSETNVSIILVGVGDRTSEYAITYPSSLAASGNDTLIGGMVDTLIYTVTKTGTTTGTALVHAKVKGIDVNSSEVLYDDTYNGGWSNMAVQTPGSPRITETVAERDSVTSGQSTPWSIVVELCNEGESALTLLPDSAEVYYNGGSALSFVKPVAFTEGGLTLNGSECKHILFTVSPTPVIPEGKDIVLNARIVLIENNSLDVRSFDTGKAGTGQSTIRVQKRAAVRIASVANGASRSPFVNVGQRFPVVFTLENTGEAQADSVSVKLTASNGSSVEDTVITIVGMKGSSTLVDSFTVTAASAVGTDLFTSSIVRAVDANSGEDTLVDMLPSVDDTAEAVIQRPAVLVVTSVEPSQGEVNAGQTADWTVRVNMINSGEAPVVLQPPNRENIAFSISGDALNDYLVIEPDTLASGKSSLELIAGESDAFIYTVSTTGSDTGIVNLTSSVKWNDANDPLRGTLVSSSDTTVHVKEPSGLRITSIVSDAPNNDKIPNTSIVDLNQSFNIYVTVGNTGGDDIDSVSVRLVSDGASTIETVGEPFKYIQSNNQVVFTFRITAGGTPGTEILSASIDYAVSVNTGETVTPAEAIESVEYVDIQTPVSLLLNSSITDPRGAMDDTLSAGQTFVVSAAVVNNGEASCDQSGEVSLVLPAGVTLADTEEPLTRQFTVGQTLSWSLIAD